jgi:MoxR-like ATPase
LPRLLRYIQRGKHVYLYGAPGGGKSTAAEQAAEALGREYFYISLNPQSPRSDLQGLIDAMGTYRTALFRKAVEFGHLILLDEGDNASAATAVIMNTVLANGWGSFPDGMVKVHANFVCVVAGNTSGRGADPMFPERRLQDSAFLDRFRFIEWTYDEALEEALSLARNPKAGAWIEWIRTCRAFVARERIRGLYFTPRASIYGADDLLHESAADTAEALCFRGCSEDVRKRVLSAHPIPSVSMV